MSYSNIKRWREFNPHNEEIRSALSSLKTTGAQKGDDSKVTTSSGQTSSDNIKDMSTKKTFFATKAKRLAKGENPFIDNQNGSIIAMDLLLSEEEMDKVIQLWEEGKKEDAANILKTFAIRERNQQFNLAFGIMMSALCLGTGACLSKLKANSITKVENLDGIGYNNALLKFYREIADVLGIDNPEEFTKGTASKQKLFELFKTLAKAKGVSLEEFLKQMFTITHKGNQEIVDIEMDWLSNAMKDDNIKTVGDVFNKTNAGDYTGRKGFRPFGINSSKSAAKLQDFFNSIEGIGKKTTTEFTEEIIGGSDLGKSAVAGSIAGEPNSSNVRKNESYNQILYFDDFKKIK